VIWVWCDRLARSQMAVADFFGIRPNAVSQTLRRARERGEERADRDTVERVIRRLRHRLMQRIEISAGETTGGTSAAKKREQVLLLQRLREIDERLFGPVLYPGPDRDGMPD
jgi:hypothetical protein